MIEILEFIFHNFWTFSGVIIILAVIFNGMTNVIIAFRYKKIREEKQNIWLKKPKVYDEKNN